MRRLRARVFRRRIVHQHRTRRVRDAVLRKRRHEDGAKAMRRRQRSTDDEQAHVRLTEKVDDAVAYVRRRARVFVQSHAHRPTAHLVGVLLKERGQRAHGSTDVLLDVLGRDVFVFALRLVVAMEEKDDVAGKN